MDFLRPGSLDEALAMKAERPAALPVAGGTDVMVEINFDARRPEALLDLSRVLSLSTWKHETPGMLRIGAGVCYARMVGELGSLLPGLAMAARTVGSPQIRNRGTIGGNLGSASPAGDCHPVLLAAGAVVEVMSVRGRRLVRAADFFTGPKRSALEPDELITAVLVPAAPGPQQFAKVGTRNAMVIAVCAFALELRVAASQVGTGIGSAGPTPLRAVEAEEFLAARLPWDSPGPLADSLTREFGALVAAAARPIDDVRGTAEYRRHALTVLARRTLTWAWDGYRKERSDSCG
ncbi:MAG: FAD binding domain-containing protein [Streptosporangiaceae bacterium]|nr:FAD binding domain-containing protein [Streptosporangiaceae bacterium]